MFSFTVQEPPSQHLELKQVVYTQMPEQPKLRKIARLYANAFAELPWNEYEVCQNGHYFGRQLFDLTSCPRCASPLKKAHPEEETSEYIAKELLKPEGTLVTFEDVHGEIFAAGWGYSCTTEELQAKYSSLEMRKKVVDRIMKTSQTVQKVFYLSEIMVDKAVQKRGITTKITKNLFEKAELLNLNFVIRTHGDSPMIRVASKLQLSQVIGMGEDIDHPNRVLYMKT
jgi:hypothetical protein